MIPAVSSGMIFVVTDRVAVFLFAYRRCPFAALVASAELGVFTDWIASSFELDASAVKVPVTDPALTVALP